MIRFTLKDSVLTAILNEKEIGSYKLGADSCTIGETEHPILGCDNEKKELDFLIYIEDEFYQSVLSKVTPEDLLDMSSLVPSYRLSCNSGHVFEKTIFHPLGLRASLLVNRIGPLKVFRSECPECLYLSQ